MNTGSPSRSLAIALRLMSVKALRSPASSRRRSSARCRTATARAGPRPYIRPRAGEISTSSWSWPTTPTIQLRCRSRDRRPGSRPPRPCRRAPCAAAWSWSDRLSTTRRRISGAKLGRPVKRIISLLGQRIADPQRAVIGDADDVARTGLVGQLAVLREEQDRRVHRDRLAVPGRRQLHAAPERARAQPHEGDPVAMLRVHVGLHLEDEAGDLVAVGIDRRRARRAAAAAAGAMPASASISSATPNSLSAEPK